MMLMSQLPQYEIEKMRKAAKEKDPTLTEEELKRKYPDTNISIEEFLNQPTPRDSHGNILMF